MKELVLLDLDDTLIKGQSQKILLKYLFDKKLINWVYFAKIYWWFMLYKLGLVQEPRMIMQYAYLFVKNKTVDEIAQLMNDFFQDSLKNYIYDEAVDLIKQHQERGRVLVIVSNAAEFIVKPLAKFLKVKYYIATKLENEKGVYTGLIDGNNVYGKYKITYIEKFINDNGFRLKNSFAYSDHNSDIPMLEMAEYPIVTNPDKLLLREAKKRKWKVLSFEK